MSRRSCRERLHRRPSGLKAPLADATYGSKTPLFRRTSAQAKLTLFDGEREVVHQAALTWLSEQHKHFPCVGSILGKVIANPDENL
jgi:hypothetical protein